MICEMCGKEFDEKEACCPHCGYVFSSDQNEPEKEPETPLKENPEEKETPETAEEDNILPIEEPNNEELVEECAEEEESPIEAEAVSEEDLPEENEDAQTEKEEVESEDHLPEEEKKAETPPAPVTKKSGRSFSRMMLAGVLLLVLATASLIAFLYETSPGTLYGRALTHAREEAEALRYEEALKYYAEAEKYNETGEDLREEVKGVYDSWAKEYEGKSDYEKAIEIYEAAIGVFPDKAMEYDTLIVGDYVTWANALARDTEYSQEAKTEVDAILEDAKIKGYQVDRAIDDLNSIYHYRENSRELEESANTIAKLLDGGHYEDALTELKNIQIQLNENDAFAKENQLEISYPLIFDVKRRKAPQIAFYRYGTEDYQQVYWLLYYGSVKDGVREGRGSVLSYIFNRYTYETREDYYTADWQNDLPQGEFEEHLTVRKGVFDSNDVQSYTVRGTLNDGVYDGDFELTDAQEIRYKGSFVSGHIMVISETDGKNVIAESGDGTHQILWTDEQLKQLYGVVSGVKE